MTVGSICNREVVVAQRNTTIPDAARLMRKYHVGDLVIVEERTGGRVPVGMVTDRDLVVEVLAEELDLNAVTVGDVMSYDMVMAREDDSIWETVQRMRLKGIRRLPIIDQQGLLAGILTMDDLLELLAGELADLSKVVNREQDRERKRRRA